MLSASENLCVCCSTEVCQDPGPGNLTMCPVCQQYCSYWKLKVSIKKKVCCHKLNFNVVERHFSLFALENYSGQCNIGKLLLGTKGTSTASISWDSRIFFLFHKVIDMENLIQLSIKY